MRTWKFTKHLNFTAERLSYNVSRLFAATTVLLLVGIFLFLTITGIGTFRHVPFKEFFLGTNWNPTAYQQQSWGILALVVGSLIVSSLALVFAIPLGFAIALYLSEVASPRKREILKPLVETVASVPSVVLGLLGLIVFAPVIARLFHVSSGLNALTASFLVGIIAVPTIASICEDALRNVNMKFREASMALGATKWTTIGKVVIPAAVSGITAGVMLGFGRAVGETMIVLMVAGNSRAFPTSFLSPVRPMTATIAIDIKEAVVGTLHWQSLFAIGLVLFVVTFFLNVIADIILHIRKV